METSPCCNSVVGHQIATNFCTSHDSTAVVPCTKFCSDHYIRIKMRVKRNFHRIWIAMEKLLVKRGHVRCFWQSALNECDNRPVAIYLHFFVYSHVAFGVISYKSLITMCIITRLVKVVIRNIDNDVYLHVQSIFCFSAVFFLHVS